MQKLDENLRKKMLGFLPFDDQSCEKFTPKECDVLPEEFRPIFHIIPWNQEEQSKIEVLTNKLTMISDGESVSKKEKESINFDLNELTRKKIIDIENLYDLGKDEFMTIEKDEGHISANVWKALPKSLQTSIYYCLNGISGLCHAEKLGL